MALVPGKFFIFQKGVPDGVDPCWFFHACLYGHHQQVRKILRQSEDFDVNALNSSLPVAQSSLHLAVMMGHVPLVQLLLDHKGVDPTVKNGEGKDALELAVEKGKDT